MGDLFVHQFEEVHDAEHRIARALPKMVAKATSPALRQAFETRLFEAEAQVGRFDKPGIEAGSVALQAIDGFVAQAEKVDDAAVLDAGLLAAAQAVEHREIARYGMLVA